MNIIYPSTSMRSHADDNSDLETEALFGEEVLVLEEKGEWNYCRLLTDNYLAWIKKKYLGELKKPTHRVLSIRSSVFSEKNIKSCFIQYLPLGSKIHVKAIDNGWAKIILSDKHKFKTGYVPYIDLVEINHKTKDWVSIAEQLVGTPYKWGGRDTVAIDCSALLQLSYESFGENIPRNTKEQIFINKEPIQDMTELYRGHVIFWEGHVGIMTDKTNCLHANAYHMKTTIEPLTKIISRMQHNNPIIKVLNFNK